jgi:Domain of unknown function (DUF1883).
MMAQIPYADSHGHLTVEVHLKHAADVFLVDSSNFQKYQSGKNFEYYGGYYDHNPVQISVSGAGRWYLIVNSTEQYQYRFF